MWYWIFLTLNAAEMIWESRVAARNSAALVQKGAVEIAPRILPLMILLYFVMYAGCFAESYLMPRRIPVWWSASFLVLFFLAKLLKLWAVKSLGHFWTMKVLVLPGAQVVRTGPYRHVRHPNYAAVLTELGATALLGKCFATFVAVFTAFCVLLYYRIQVEEKALMRYTDYGSMTELRRFVP